jgi:SAM-dependent methyltransferase
MDTKDPHPRIHERGYWIGANVLDQHFTDFQLAIALVHFFKIERASSIVDFGCGTADYVKMFRNQGLPCEGYDGNPDTPQLTDGIAKVLDLSQPFDLGQKFDWVLSLEVGEHLPKQYQATFIENLIRHCVRGVILSWAIKGQGGFGHFNEQGNEKIKNAFSQRGFTNDLMIENRLRNYSRLSWFKNTLMVFRR